jgi:ABC-type multidrug transport system fused ATPase/permease subunit
MISTAYIVKDFVRRNKWLSVAITQIVLFNSVLNVLIPLSIGKFYELALKDEGSSKGWLFEQLGIHILNVRQYFLFFIGLVLLKALLSYLEHALTGALSERFAKELREELFRNQLQQSVKSFEQKPPGKYLLRYGGDLVALQKLITRGIIGFSGDVLFLILALLLLLMLNPILGIIFVTGIPLAGIIISFFKGGLRKRSVQRRNQRSSMLSFVSSRFEAFLSIKAFNRETPEYIQFNRKSESFLCII